MGTHHIWEKQGFVKPPKWHKTALVWPLSAHPTLGKDARGLQDPILTEIANFGPV